MLPVFSILPLLYVFSSPVLAVDEHTPLNKARYLGCIETLRSKRNETCAPRRSEDLNHWQGEIGKNMSYSLVGQLCTSYGPSALATTATKQTTPLECTCGQIADKIEQKVKSMGIADFDSVFALLRLLGANFRRRKSKPDR